jgi:hypothetical protein
VINTISRSASGEIREEDPPTGSTRPVRDGFRIRQAAVQRGIPCLTSLDTAAALVEALESQRAGGATRIATIDEHRRSATAGVPL